MKPLFHYFGIGRNQKSFAIKDPIMLEGGYRVLELDEYTIRKLWEVTEKIKGEFRGSRGIFFGSFPTKEKTTEFLKLGEMLAPEIGEKGFSIYFVKSCILFKINENGLDLKKAKAKASEILSKAGVLSKKEFKDKTKEWIEDEYQTLEEINVYSFEDDNYKVSIGISYYTFVSVFPKDLKGLKKKVKETFTDIAEKALKDFKKKKKEAKKKHN